MENTRQSPSRFVRIVTSRHVIGMHCFRNAFRDDLSQDDFGSAHSELLLIQVANPLKPASVKAIATTFVFNRKSTRVASY